ncbi:MAG TPA: hypothetical protein VFQ53_31745 [Kofleriaceae bacterium]|nr:hypothetical protein [Kofleriaceae bacterium]
MRWLVVLAALASCTGRTTAVGSVRFANAPAVERVDDRQDVPKPPRERAFRRYLHHFDSYYLRTVRGMELRPHQRALGISALDEVPDSTWFTNRIGRRALSPEEIRRGPEPSDSPEHHLPWTIKSAKAGGTAIGFVAEDTRGVKFILKFDEPRLPEVETGADAIVARLLWATGYNVPADHVVYFTPDQLRVGKGAYRKVDGDKLPIDDAYVQQALAQVSHEPDGRIRGIASTYIAGKPLGGTPRLGVRADDPNDLIPHELRRDQRGLAALCAWLAHTDIREDNTLDSWQADPKNPAIHYVVHYLVDFGNALGADAAISNHLYIENQYEIDPAASLSTILTLGLSHRRWEDRRAPPIRGIGLYGTTGYAPGKWKPNTPAQLPVIWADRFDQFWGAKILIRFTRDQLAAAVDAARYTDPRATAYMIDTLVARQRRTAQHWFQQVNPVDDFAIDGDRLCFTDLALRHQLEVRATRFTLRVFDDAGRALAAPITADPDASGRACASIALAPGASHYTIVRIESSRGMPGTLVHVATSATGQPRVIGIHRL